MTSTRKRSTGTSIPFVNEESVHADNEENANALVVRYCLDDLTRQRTKIYPSPFQWQKERENGKYTRTRHTSACGLYALRYLSAHLPMPVLARPGGNEANGLALDPNAKPAWGETWVDIGQTVMILGKHGFGAWEGVGLEAVATEWICKIYSIRYRNITERKTNKPELASPCNSLPHFPHSPLLPRAFGHPQCPQVHKHPNPRILPMDLHTQLLGPNKPLRQTIPFETFESASQ